MVIQEVQVNIQYAVKHISNDRGGNDRLSYHLLFTDDDIKRNDQKFWISVREI